MKIKYLLYPNKYLKLRNKLKIIFVKIVIHMSFLVLVKKSKIIYK